MKKIIHLDEDNLTVTAQSGVILRDLETYFKQNNYTGGHFPQSIELAQLGGLVSTTSSGRFSTNCGHLADFLSRLESVLPTGETIRLRDVRLRSVGRDS